MTNQNYMKNDENINVGVTEVPLFGTMIYAETTVKEIEAVQASHDVVVKALIKKRLADKLIEHMFENEMIEYSIQDNLLDNTKTVRARVCVTPNEQIKLLRIHVK